MSKLFVLHGTDSKTGVSMLTQSLAELIAEQRPQLRVLIANLQGRYGASYTDYVGESVEGLRHYLDNRLLNKQELLSGCRFRQNLYIIGGVSAIGEERYYQPEMSNYLLSELREDFDLILADSGSELDNGLALGALVMADEPVLVMTQQESALRRYEKLKPLYSQLGIGFSITLCNRFEAEDPHTREYLCKRLDVQEQQLLTVREAESGRLAELEEKTLLAYRNQRYRGDLALVAERFLKLAGFEQEENGKKKKWKSFI